MCYCEDNDFFRTLHSDKIDVVTGTIRTVTANGIHLEDRTMLDADVIITATGFKMDFAASIPFTVDHQALAWPGKLIWNGSMIQDVPNMFLIWGYTNAAWVLAADATALSTSRVLNHMERQGKHVVVPRTLDGFETELQAMWKL